MSTHREKMYVYLLMNSYFTIAYIDYKHTDNGFKIYQQGLVFKPLNAYTQHVNENRNHSLSIPVPLILKRKDYCPF